MSDLFDLGLGALLTDWWVNGASLTVPFCVGEGIRTSVCYLGENDGEDKDVAYFPDG